MRTKRLPIEIMADILRLDEASKTKIGLSGEMCSYQVCKYLRYLEQKGFITKINNNHRCHYRVTPLGKQLLESIDDLTEVLDKAG